MNQDVLPQVGDVIRSIRFVYGERSFDRNNKRVAVGRDDPQYIVGRYPTDEEIVSYVQKFGKMPPKSAPVEEDYGSPDLTRAKAEYVVVEAQMQGGGPIQGDSVGYPDGWHVVAKRLDDGRKWNPLGEEIEFYMTGCFLNMIPPNKIKIVGRMEYSFT